MGDKLRSRGGHKVLKPQFFAQYRREKENIGHLDTAAAHLVKKGIAASKALADQPLTQESNAHPPWPGLLTKRVLATEMLPFMFKIGSLARCKNLSYLTHIGMSNDDL